MPHDTPDARRTQVVKFHDIEAVNVLGPVIEFLTPPSAGTPCTMRGTIPAGVVIPLHSHADPETYVVESGAAEALRDSERGYEWVSLRAGDVLHVPGNAKHAFRNTTDAPAIMLVISTAKIGRFFREIGTPVGAPPPSAAAVLQRFLETAARYGYWNATPEENARVGIALPAV